MTFDSSSSSGTISIVEELLASFQFDINEQPVAAVASLALAGDNDNYDIAGDRETVEGDDEEENKEFNQQQGHSEAEGGEGPATTTTSTTTPSTAAVSTPPPHPNSGRLCHGCYTVQPKNRYSNRQWKKRGLCDSCAAGYLKRDADRRYADRRYADRRDVDRRDADRSYARRERRERHYRRSHKPKKYDYLGGMTMQEFDDCN